MCAGEHQRALLRATENGPGPLSGIITKQPASVETSGNSWELVNERPPKQIDAAYHIVALLAVLSQVVDLIGESRGPFVSGRRVREEEVIHSKRLGLLRLCGRRIQQSLINVSATEVFVGTRQSFVPVCTLTFAGSVSINNHH